MAIYANDNKQHGRLPISLIGCIFFIVIIILNFSVIYNKHKNKNDGNQLEPIKEEPRTVGKKHKAPSYPNGRTIHVYKPDGTYDIYYSSDTVWKNHGVLEFKNRETDEYMIVAPAGRGCGQ